MTSPLRVYVASSWRNTEQPAVVGMLRDAGCDVYDFRNPEPGDTGFSWSKIDPDWQLWTTRAFREVLEHPIAKAGFAKDMRALEWCDLCVLVLPCGRSAHLELGWACGASKRTAVLLRPGEPELMYRMVDELFVHAHDLQQYVLSLRVTQPACRQCDGDGRVETLARGNWTDCITCKGTGLGERTIVGERDGDRR